MVEAHIHTFLTKSDPPECKGILIPSRSPFIQTRADLDAFAADLRDFAKQIETKAADETRRGSALKQFEKVAHWLRGQAEFRVLLAMKHLRKSMDHSLLTLRGEEPHDNADLIMRPHQQKHRRLHQQPRLHQHPRLGS